MSKNSENATANLVGRVDTLCESLRIAPSASRNVTAEQLSDACDDLYGVLCKAWDWLGVKEHRDNDAAFNRYWTALRTYERGMDQVMGHRTQAALFGFA